MQNLAQFCRWLFPSRLWVLGLAQSGML